MSFVHPLHHHLLSLLMAAILAMGSGGLLAVHAAAEHQHDHAAAPHPECKTCQSIDATTGALPAAPAAPLFLELVCVCDAHTPAVLPAPLPLRAVCARPPPCC